MNTTTAPERTPATKAKRRRKHVDHFFNYDAGEFARQHSLSVRAFCGVWVPLSPRLENYRVVDTGTYSDDCKRCLATLNRMRREAKR